MKKQDITAIIFVSIAVFSVIAVIGPALNFANFYFSLEELHLKALKVSVQNEQTINVTFTILHNYSYTGLKLSYVKYDLYFILDGVPTMLIDGGTSYSSPILLDPYGNFTYADSKVLNPNRPETQTFIELSQSQQDIEWMLDGTLDVDTYRGTIPVELSYP